MPASPGWLRCEGHRLWIALVSRGRTRLQREQNAVNSSRLLPPSAGLWHHWTDARPGSSCTQPGHCGGVLTGDQKLARSGLRTSPELGQPLSCDKEHFGRSLARGCCPAGAPLSHPTAVHALGQVLVGLGMMQGDGWGLPLQWVAGFRLVPPISLFGKKKARQLGRSHGTLAGGGRDRGHWLCCVWGVLVSRLCPGCSGGGGSSWSSWRAAVCRLTNVHH